jgi:hypothetical protein
LEIEVDKPSADEPRKTVETQHTSSSGYHDSISSGSELGISRMFEPWHKFYFRKEAKNSNGNLKKSKEAVQHVDDSKKKFIF